MTFPADPPPTAPGTPARPPRPPRPPPAVAPTRHVDTRALAYARARRIAEFIPDGLALLDLDGMIRWVSPSLVRMSGRPASELLDRPATVLVLGADAVDLAEGLAAAGDEAMHRTARAHTPNGWRWAELAWRVVSDPDEAVPDEIVLSWRDVHDQQLELLAMTALAQHDELTGLANRAGLARRLEQLAGQGMAVLYVFVDLDGFKAVNDLHGHPAGDELLVGVAHRLRSVVRGNELVARLGGDEFAVVQQGETQPAHAGLLSERIVAALAEPFEIAGQGVRISASIGVAVFPTDAASPTDLIKNADMALYRAKAEGRGLTRFYEAAMDEALRQRRQLETDLRLAIANTELAVHYQPLADLESGTILGFEALLRWTHPRLGPIAPDVFIRLAEESGLILKLGEWVLREACRWATFIGVERGLPVSVNLSARQFNDPKLAQIVAGALKETGLPARLRDSLRSRAVEKYRLYRSRAWAVAFGWSSASRSSAKRTPTPGRLSPCPASKR